MPYTLKNAVGDELAFLESSCEVLTLQGTLINLNLLSDYAKFFAEEHIKGCGLTDPRRLRREMEHPFAAIWGSCLAVLRIPTQLLENEAGDEEIADSLLSVMNAAGNAFFRTLPLIRAENPVAELLMPSCVLELDEDMDDITDKAIDIYTRHYRSALQQFTQNLNALKRALGSGEKLQQRARRTPFSSMWKTHVLTDQTLEAWRLFINGWPELARAAVETRAALKTFLRERLLSAYADLLTPGAEKRLQRMRRGRAPALSTLLWQRWQDHADNMEEYFFSLKEETENPGRQHTASYLATILDKVARHPATSAMLRRYVQGILEDEELTAAVRDWDFTDLASMPTIP